MQKKALVGTLLVLIALIMIGLSLIMPWYSLKATYPDNPEYNDRYEDYYLDHYEGGAMGLTIKVNYDKEEIKDYQFVQTFGVTQIMTFIGLIGCVLGLIGAAMVTAGKLSSKVATFFVFLAIILSLIAPLYLMFTLPSTLEEDAKEQNSTLPSDKMGADFFGSDEIEEENWDETVTMEISWGGASGWFLAIFAAIICIIAIIPVALSRPARAQEMFFTPAPMMPEPSPQSQFEGTFTPQIQEPQMRIAPAPAASIPPAAHREEFQCPECNRIFILPPARKPVIARCPYCGLEGLVE